MTGSINSRIEHWVKHFQDPGSVPFSFVYRGQKTGEFLEKWSLEKGVSETSDKKMWFLTYQEGKTGLQVKCQLTWFRNFPVVEWVLKFQNSGREKTPIIQDIWVLDSVFEGEDKITLHWAKGSNAERDDFSPQEKILSGCDSFILSPVGGRSSNTTALPFFHLHLGSRRRLLIALGWSGQWLISFQKKEEGLLVKTGQEKTFFRLYPGEEIRTPRVLLLFGEEKDFVSTQNNWRRFLLAQYLPRRKGRAVCLPFACTSSGPPDEANKTTAEEQLEFATFFRKNYGSEYLWIDAGWFEGGWPNGVGNWFVRKNGFADGFRHLTEKIKKMGMKGLILWFEPERVFQGTWIDRQQPDWVIRIPDNPNRLLNLGKEEALNWLTDHISSFIQREGISVYRHDFNMNPLPYWQSADSPERQGITEIYYIQGLYRFWDQLLERHPGLIIDNCASGGRRIDLETISRSVMLWRSDYKYFEPEGKQNHLYGISFYLPTSSTSCGYPVSYLSRSGLGNGMVLWTAWYPQASYDVYRKFLPPVVDWQPGKSLDLKLARKLVQEFQKARKFFYGDYYPLSSYDASEKGWLALQFHREDLQAGMVLVFRREKCTKEEYLIKFQAVKPDFLYRIEISDEICRKEKKILPGEKIRQGLQLIIQQVPGSRLIFYKREVQRKDA